MPGLTSTRRIPSTDPPTSPNLMRFYFSLLLLVMAGLVVAFVPLPVPAVAIESLSSLGFFDPDIRIQAANGETYMLQWLEDGRQWSTENQHETRNFGEYCSAEILSLMQDRAGSIVDCQTAPIAGEWCPGPIVSVAVTETGEVWQMAENEPCGFVFRTSLFLIEVLSLLVGLFLASFKLIAKWFPFDNE